MQLSSRGDTVNLIANTEHSQGEVNTKGLQRTYMKYISPEGTDNCYGNWCKSFREEKLSYSVTHSNGTSKLSRKYKSEREGQSGQTNRFISNSLTMLAH